MCAQQFCEAGNWVWTVWKRSEVSGTRPEVSDFQFWSFYFFEKFQSDVWFQSLFFRTKKHLTKGGGEGGPFSYCKKMPFCYGKHFPHGAPVWLWRHSLVWHFVVIGVRPNRRRPRRNPLTWVPNETVVYQHLKLVVIFPEEGRWRRNGKCSCLILGVESRSKSWRSHTQDFILAYLCLTS